MRNHHQQPQIFPRQVHKTIFQTQVRDKVCYYHRLSGTQERKFEESCYLHTIKESVKSSANKDRHSNTRSF